MLRCSQTESEMLPRADRLTHKWNIFELFELKCKLYLQKRVKCWPLSVCWRHIFQVFSMTFHHVSSNVHKVTSKVLRFSMALRRAYTLFMVFQVLIYLVTSCVKWFSWRHVIYEVIYMTSHLVNITSRLVLSHFYDVKYCVKSFSWRHILCHVIFVTSHLVLSHCHDVTFCMKSFLWRHTLFQDLYKQGL